jgi:ABC-type Mn2+/Zn2+ transport system permease subunit
MYTLNYLFYPICATLLIGILAGIMSPIIVLYNEGFTVHLIGHLNILGLVISYVLGAHPLSIQCIINYVFIFLVRKFKSTHNDQAPAMLSNLGLALGFLAFYYLQQKGKIFLFLSGASLLSISGGDCILIVSTLALVIMFFIVYNAAILFVYLEQILATTYTYIRKERIELLLYLLITLVSTIVSYFIGSLLSFTLLIGPGSIVIRNCDSFASMIFFSVLITILTMTLSLLLSFYFDIPISICVTLLISLVYLLDLLRLQILKIS